MNKNAITWGVVIVVLLMAWGNYNSIVSLDEDVSAAWSEMQSQLKRRSDLVPNLINTVKGYAKHEQGTFTAVTEARARVGQVATIDVSKLANDPLLQKQLLEAQQGLTSALGRLLAVAENYPELKANQNFLKLQDELAGTENRIAVARGRAITATKVYNKYIRQFPAVIVAKISGFEQKTQYQASEQEQALPVVVF